MTRTLVVTNDFPPRAGGIQTYVHSLASRLPAGRVVVYASDSPGSRAFDAAQPFPVVRHGGGLLLPVPRVARRAREIARAEGCTSVWFGAAAPLALLTRELRRGGIERFVASTHGHETGWAKLPGARQLLHRIGADVDVVTCITGFTRGRLQRALGSRAKVVQLPPGVDTGVMHPGVDGAAVRVRCGLAGRPVVVCVSRLVRRKGQDVLIRALPLIRRQIPGAALLLVGDGPDLPMLRRLAAVQGGADDVVFAGAVAWEDLPAYFAAGDVFAMPCRTRRAGLDVEGLGMVYLEAAAIGLPVVAGNSGGAPEAVRHGETGYVVTDPASPEAVAARIVPLLADAELRATFGAAGRDWVLREWRWDQLAARLHGLLIGPSG
ncbi:glycosyltransferase family 4 protein [soil metagenome]